MKVLYTLIFILIFGFGLSAQQAGNVATTIKGKVIDAKTNKAISYTNIGIVGTLHGTASDAEGNFELKIPEEFTGMNIYFSAVGFQNRQFPVNNLFGNDFNVIKLQAQTYGIDEVDIDAKNMVLIRILRMASEEIKYNYIKGPYNLNAKYSNKKTVNDTLITEQNFDVLIYDRTGYSNPSKADAYKSLKYSLKTDTALHIYSFADGTTNIDELLETDWVRLASSVLNPPLTAGFRLKLEDEPTIGGKEYWVISFSQNKPALAATGDFYAATFEGKITVNKKDYSVLNISTKVTAPKSNRQGRSLAIGDSNKNYFENVSYNTSVSYKNNMPETVETDKSYTYKGEKITEHSVLKIIDARASNITELNSRQYFTGK